MTTLSKLLSTILIILLCFFTYTTCKYKKLVNRIETASNSIDSLQNQYNLLTVQTDSSLSQVSQLQQDLSTAQQQLKTKINYITTQHQKDESKHQDYHNAITHLHRYEYLHDSILTYLRHRYSISAR